MRNSVDLPQPDGPTMATNSPGVTVRLVLATAWVPSANVLVTSVNSSTVASVRSGGSVAVRSVVTVASVHDHATGDVERLAGAVGGVVGRQEQGHAGDVGRLGAASER